MNEILKAQGFASEIEFSNCVMNPLGGVLRKRGLTMWDSGLRYYCPYEELKQISDIETAKTKQFKGKSKLAIICAGETYYISNDWYAPYQPRPTKTYFLIWLMTLTVQACNVHWEKIKSSNESPDEEKISVSAADLKALINSVKVLTDKVDNLTVQIEELKNIWN